MIRSMTGFGAAEGEVGGAVVAVEVRSVNHRFFNPSIKLPSEFARWEGDVREALRRGVRRGHVTLVARIAREEQAEGRIDETRFAAYVDQLRRLQERYHLEATLDVGTILRLPDVLASPEDGVEGTAPELVDIVRMLGGGKVKQSQVGGICYRHHMRGTTDCGSAIDGWRHEIAGWGIAAQLLHSMGV